MSCLSYVTESNVAECFNCPIKVSELVNKINLLKSLLDSTFYSTKGDVKYLFHTKYISCNIKTDNIETCAFNHIHMYFAQYKC